MSATVKLKPLGIDEYLAAEETSEVRHELVDGYLFAMVGISQRHNSIAGSVYSLLRAHLRDTPCRVFMSDLKVRIGNDFYYPDLVVSCQVTDPASVVAADPKLIVEVSSPCTESRDRFEKRLTYQRLESLLEYVLIAQERPQVEVFRRRSDGWEVETYATGETAWFESLDLSVALRIIYEDVGQFPP